MRFLLTAMLLAAACSSSTPPAHTRVERVRDHDGGWVFPISKTEGIVLDATGEKATLVFGDKVIIVEHFAEFEGVLAEHEVILSGPFQKLHVTPERARMTVRQQDRVIALADIPKDHEAIYRNGAWVVEKVED